MVVITLTDTPPKIRGDLSKWLLEVNTGVYVGNVSTRVREKLWERVCANLKNGRATMVYNASNEQKMDFRVYNSAWEPVDYEGLKLIRHPITGCGQKQENSLTEKGFSKAAKNVRARKMTDARRGHDMFSEYIVIDLETTGLSYEKDHIIEMAALRISDGEVAEEFSKLIKIEDPLPESVVQLTGITNEMINKNGEPIDTVLGQFIEFIQSEAIVGFNTAFDLNFIQTACRSLGISMQWDFKVIDTLKIAKRKIRGISDYKLNTLGKYFDMDVSGLHRALKDCYLTYGLYEKLNEIN